MTKQTNHFDAAADLVQCRINYIEEHEDSLEWYLELAQEDCNLDLSDAEAYFQTAYPESGYTLEELIDQGEIELRAMPWPTFYKPRVDDGFIVAGYAIGEIEIDLQEYYSKRSKEFCDAVADRTDTYHAGDGRLYYGTDCTIFIILDKSAIDSYQA